MTSPSTRSPRNSSRSFDCFSLALAWVSARSKSAASRNLCPSRASRSVNEGEQPLPAGGFRPLPEFPEFRAAIGGEEDQFGLADKVLGWNVAYIGAAVVGIVAVVAHHEVVAGRHNEDVGVVGRAVGIAVEHEIVFAVGERFAIARHMMADAELVGFDVIGRAHLGYRLVVDIELAVQHLDAVA